jgi:DNA-directed RNA polymerase specialized sigma24 family protein
VPSGVYERRPEMRTGRYERKEWMRANSGGKVLSPRARKAIRVARRAGRSLAQVAEEFEVSRSTVARIERRSE